MSDTRRSSTLSRLLTGRLPGEHSFSFLTRALQPDESLGVRATRGVVWNLIGTTFNQGSTFAANVLLANVLGVRLFGEYAIVQSTISVFSVLGQLAMASTATKYVAELRVHHHDRIGRLIGTLGAVSSGMALVAALLLFMGGPWIATVLLQEPGVAGPLRVASVVLFFAVANGFLIGALAGLEHFTAIGRVGVIGGSFYLVAAVAGGMLAELHGALIGIGLSGLLQLALYWVALRSELHRIGIRLRLGFAETDAGILVRFAVPAALNGFVSVPAIWFGNALLVRQPGGFDSMALFAAANSFRVLVLFLPNIVNNVNMALINYQRGVRDSARFRRVFWVNLAATLGIVLAGATGVTLLAPWLLGLFGPEFAAGQAVLLVLMLVTIPESLSLALRQIIQSHERLWYAFWGVTVPCYATLAALAWFLIPIMGARGLAWAYLAAWVLALAANTLMVRRLGIDIAPRVR